jgi:hypothetical protein
MRASTPQDPILLGALLSDLADSEGRGDLLRSQTLRRILDAASQEAPASWPPSPGASQPRRVGEPT